MPVRFDEFEFDDGMSFDKEDLPHSRPKNLLMRPYKLFGRKLIGLLEKAKFFSWTNRSMRLRLQPIFHQTLPLQPIFHRTLRNRL